MSTTFQSTEVENHLILVVVASSSFLCHKLILESLLLPLGQSMGYHKGSEKSDLLGQTFHKGIRDFLDASFLTIFFPSIKGVFLGVLQTTTKIHGKSIGNPWKPNCYPSVSSTTEVRTVMWFLMLLVASILMPRVLHVICRSKWPQKWQDWCIFWQATWRCDEDCFMTSLHFSHLSASWPYQFFYFFRWLREKNESRAGASAAEAILCLRWSISITSLQALVKMAVFVEARGRNKHPSH